MERPLRTTLGTSAVFTPSTREETSNWRTYRRRRALSIWAAEVFAVIVSTVLLLVATGRRFDAIVAFVTCISFLLVLRIHRAHRRELVDDGRYSISKPVLSAATVCAALFAIRTWLEIDPRPGLAALALVVPIILIIESREASALRTLRLNGFALRRTLVILGAGFDDILLGLRRHPETGLLSIGYFSSGLDHGSATDPEPIASLEQVRTAVIDEGVDVVLTVGAVLPDDLTIVTRAIEGTGARLILLPGLKNVTAKRLHPLAAVGTWTSSLEVTPRRTRFIIKEIIDKIGGLILLLFALPIIAVAAIAVRLESPGPAFYSQRRVGLNGRHFTLWKLRSMRKDADALRTSVVAKGGDASNAVLFKDSHDPRITRVGAFIRRFSIDELPQLFNVVRGDMSLIGPRPALPEEVAAYDAEARRRLLVKPGLTGLWQVSGRSSLSWESTVALDQHYVDNRSIELDTRIIAKTVNAVIGGEGAY